MKKERAAAEERKLMKKAKQTDKLFAIIPLCIAFAGCGPNFQNFPGLNPAVDCKADSKFDFIQFQIDSKHPTRTIESIFSLIKSKENDLINTIHLYNENFPDPNRIEFVINVSASGNYFLTSFPGSINKDTTFNNDITKICKSLKLDSLPNYGAVAKVKVALNNQKKIEIVDSVHFYQERTKKSIMCVVMENIDSMRYAYNQHLRDHLKFSGKVVVKFAIEENGNVIHAEIIEKTIKNESFEHEMLDILKSWKFVKIYNPNDTTEVIYPFIFSY